MRLFIAVNLPDEVRRALHAAAAAVRRAAPTVKWVEPDGLHLTLKFLGGVEPERLGAVTQALERACRGARPFPLPIAGFGAFPSPERARVIWAGCEAVPPLELLQHGVEREFATLDFPLEGRPFRPHLTLGRTRPEARGGVRGLAEALARLAFADEIMVRSVEVMESTLGPRGARYATRHSVALAD